MRRLVACGAMIVVLAAGAPAGDDRAAILQVMAEGAAAWNRGDLAGFVAASYENGPGVVFVTGHDFVTGYDAILRRYRDHYGGAGGLGTLSFGDLAVRPLSGEYAMVYGRYRLVPAAPGTAPAAGVFDLLFHKSAAGWRIVSDHTS